MIRFSLPFQKSHILVKQILHCLCTPPCPKPCQRCMIRHRLFFQKPHEVHTVPTGLLQLSAGIDSALVSVRHYLEQHSRVDLRFSASGRIGAIQFPVVQFLKLGACQSDGGVLWQQNFVVQCKDQLTISLIYATLALLLVFSHKLIIKQKDEQATPFFRGDLLIFFIQLPCAILQRALLGRSKNEEKVSDFKGQRRRHSRGGQLRSWWRVCCSRRSYGIQARSRDRPRPRRDQRACR
mgnify:FL=1